MDAIEGHILVVDDDLSICEYLSSLLPKHGFSVIVCGSAREAMTVFQEKPVILFLIDIRLPLESGLELMERIRRVNPDVPVILMTAYADYDIAVEAVNKGAFSFLNKPFNQQYLVNNIQRGIEHHRLVMSGKNYMTMLEDNLMRKTRELEDTATMANKLSMEIIQRLSAVAEFRDSYTAAHVSRIGFYSKAIAEAMNMYEGFVEAIAVASSLHDIGKIGIPDKILLKKSPLTHEELEIMKGHAVMGSKILADSSNPTIQMASSIALRHHERWDGKGYPGRLRGRETPIEARIVKLADQYDALRSKRSYKPSLNHEEAYRIMVEGDERTAPEHLDPEILEVFVELAPQFDDIFCRNQD